jgi:CubicO group peptidase (beta-lactamase class C family)
MSTKLFVAACAAALFATNPSNAADPGTSWPVRTPAQSGMTAAECTSLAKATGWVSNTATPSFAGFVVEEGFQICMWGNPTKRFDWASAVKPVMSTMLFYAIDEGRTSGVNARIAQYGWALTDPDQSITFHHLANQTSGYALPENPGARWGYNDYAIALYCKTLAISPSTVPGAKAPHTVFPTTMLQTVASRFAVLQFQDGGIMGNGRSGCQLFASPRDFARVGQFWMNKGVWRGTQRLPRPYFDSFQKNQVDPALPRTAGGAPSDYLGVGSTGGNANQNILGQGSYGYNWTFNRPTVRWPSAPADTFQARGHHNGEAMFVIPSLQLIMAWKGKVSADAAVYSDANRYLSLLIAGAR